VVGRRHASREAARHLILAPLNARRRRSRTLNATFPTLPRQHPMPRRRSRPMDTKLIALPERAMELVEKWGGQAMDLVPRADKWLETSAKIGVLKSGSKVAMKFVRRNPVLVAATVAGAGALWFIARKKAKQARNGDGRDAIEGSARRIEAKRPARKTTRSTAARKSTRTRARPQAPTAES